VLLVGADEALIFPHRRVPIINNHLQHGATSAQYEALRSKADLDLSSKSLKYQGAIVVSVGLQLNPTLLSLNTTTSAILE
jgi:hypothetical protein